MDEGLQRSVVQDLVATKDTAKRQLKALHTLKGQIDNGVNVSLLIPTVAEVTTNPESALEVKREAVVVLSSFLDNPDLREKCSVFNELLGALWSCTGLGDEQSATRALRSLTSIAPEDFVRLMAAVGAEALSNRALEHRVPSMRPLAVQVLGAALVRAWPCISTGNHDDEALRDACLDILKSILARLADPDVDVGIRAAAAGVLDVLLRAYLAIEPAAFVPVALLHPAWRFGSVYATLLVELLRDLEAVLPRLSAVPGAVSLVSADCLWIPGQQGDAGSPAADAAEMPTLLAEAGSLRASLTWLLAAGGGLARSAQGGNATDLDPTNASNPFAQGGHHHHKKGHEATERHGSLIWDLVREQAVGSSHPAVIPELPMPATLDTFLQQSAGGAAAGSTSASAAPRGGAGSWRVRLGQCRARFMLGILALACGLNNAADSLLQAAELAIQLCNGSQSNVLQSFCAESCSSALTLWPMLQPRHGQPDAQQQRRFVNACVAALNLGCLVLPAVAESSPPRLLRLAGLTARALMQTLCRLQSQRAPGFDMKSVFPSLSQNASGQLSVPLLVLALLLRECRAVRSPQLATQVIQLFGPPVLREAAKGQQGGSPVERGSRGHAQAACWWFLGLVRDTCAAAGRGRAIPNELMQVLSLSHEVLGCPPLAAMLCSVLYDAGALGQLPGTSRNGAVEVVQSQASAAGPEVKKYFTLLGQAIKSAQAPARANQHLSSQLCSADLSSQTALWMHNLSDSTTREGAEFHIAGKSISLSGPPLMVSGQLAMSEASKRHRHIVFRLNLFNTTGLSFRNVHVSMSVSKSKLEDAEDREQWAFAQGRSRPPVATIEALHCRGDDVVWYDLTVHSLQALCVSFMVSYENSVPEMSGSPSGMDASQGGPSTAASPDAWSDDEDEANDRLHFACKPWPLPLSVFFSAFHGFDDPVAGSFPPPMVYMTCPHSHSEEIPRTGLDLQVWKPSGFHPISARDCQYTAADVIACFAAVAFDEESIVCFICHQGTEGKQPRLEVRSNSQKMMQDLVANFRFWVLAGAS